MSFGLPSISLTRTRHCVLGESGTVTDWLPSLAVLETSVDHEAPPFVESSIFTLPTLPTVLQVTVAELPTTQVSPPSGLVTVTVTVGVSPSGPT